MKNFRFLSFNSNSWQTLLFASMSRINLLIYFLGRLDDHNNSLNFASPNPCLVITVGFMMHTEWCL